MSIDQVQPSARLLGMSSDRPLQVRNAAYGGGLPPELLSLVFEYLVVDSFNTKLRISYETAKTSWHWVVVTHVCRYWRQVALNHSCLWGYDPCTPYKGIVAKIERAKNTPLYLRWADEYGKDLKGDRQKQRARDLVNAVLKTVFIQADRVKEVYLEDCSSDLPGTYEYRHLDTLELGPQNLRNSFCFRCADSWPHTTSVLLPPSTLLPSLKQLRITSRPFLWNHLIGLSNLISLEIEQCPEHFPPPNAHQLLQALGSMPYLRSLCLIRAVHVDNSLLPSAQDASKINALHLPNLQKLSVYDTHPRCIWLLQHISLPKNINLKVTAEISPLPGNFGHAIPEDLVSLAAKYYSYDSDEDDDTDDAEETDDARLSALALNTETWLLGERLGPRRFVHLKAWRNMPCEAPEELNDTTHEAALALTFSFPAECYNSNVLFNAFRDNLPLQDIEFFSAEALDWGSSYSGDRWMDLFYCMPLLYAVAISGEKPCAAFIRMLALNVVDPCPWRVPLKQPIWTSTKDQPPVLFRWLDTLTLIYANLEKRVEPEGYTTHRMLLRTLAARQALLGPDVEPFQLDLQLCHVSTLALKQLMEVVPDLWWISPQKMKNAMITTDAGDSSDEESFDVEI